MKKVIAGTLFFILCLGIFWYFGHHRPAQKILKAEPKVIYKSSTQNASEKPIIITHPTDATTREDTSSAESLIEAPDETSDVPSSNDTDSELVDDVSEDSMEGSPSLQSTPGSTPEALDPDSQWLIDESARIRAEWPSDKARIQAKIERANRLIDQKMPQIVNHLHTLPVEKQVVLLLRSKDMLSNRSGLFGLILKNIPPEYLDGAWQQYLDMLVKHGYTLPPEVE